MKVLADKLDDIALGKQWSESTLVESLDLSFLNQLDKVVITRYINGSQINMDHIRLQDIAIKIRNNQ